MEGLEPPHLAASDPKSDVSTNFTTCAFGSAKVVDLIWKLIFLQKKIIFFDSQLKKNSVHEMSV